jgi:hypothetical protein
MRRRSLGNWHGYFYNREGVHSGGNSMMTLVPVLVEGEHDFFKVDGWSLRGRQTIPGSSMGEDDIMQINFKISSSSGLVFFIGNFRDALTGICGPSAEIENTLGILEFRWIQPRHLAVYPRTSGQQASHVVEIRNCRCAKRRTARPLGMVVLLAASE